MKMSNKRIWLSLAHMSEQEQQYNFPIHQDVTFDEIDEMIKQLKEIIYV